MFRLSRTDNIYIYGAGQLGKDLSKRLQIGGYNILGYIDQSVNQADLPVMNLKSYFNGKCTKDDVVIITLNNGLIHDGIASKIYESGVRRVLFLPLKSRVSAIKKQQYRFAYMEVVNHYNFDVNIPIYENISGEYDNKPKYHIIRDDYKEYVSFLFPAFELYAGMVQEDPTFYESKIGKVLEKYYYKKAIEFSPYVDLFHALRDRVYDRTKLDEYMFISNRNSEEEKEKLLQDRIKLFDTYKKALSTDISFFWDAPIQCYYENGKVYIRDGYHRFFFLLSQEINLIPVILKKMEYKLLMENDAKR